MSGHTQPFEWALDRLRRDFGAERVDVEVAEEGRTVRAAVRPGEGDRRPYTVILNDPILGDVNRMSDPRAFMEAEVRFAHDWLDGKSQRFRTYG